MARDTLRLAVGGDDSGTAGRRTEAVGEDLGADHVFVGARDRSSVGDAVVGSPARTGLRNAPWVTPVTQD